MTIEYMLYISIRDSSVELIQTKKTFFSESVTACAQKELPVGVVKDGVIHSPQDLVQELQVLFSAAYPRPIRDSEAIVAVADTAAVVGRLSLPKAAGAEDIGLSAMQEMKKSRSFDPLTYENFYKILAETSDTMQVLYAAMTNDIIASYLSLFQLMNVRVRALTSYSFALYELLKPLISANQILLYCQVKKTYRQYVSVDRLGPILNDEEAVSAHDVAAGAIIRQIHALEEMQRMPFTRIMLAGESIPAESVDEISRQTGLPVTVLNSHIHALTIGLKMDTGGMPLEDFAVPVGIYRFARAQTSADFSQGMKPLRKTTSEPPADVSIVEYQRFAAPWILLAVCGLGAVGAGLYLVMKRPVSHIAFFSGPTITPTITSRPSQTPTPTIDRTLKKTDLTISVHNGTDKAGHAREVGEYLEEKGYTVSETINADAKDYEQTVVRIKSAKRSYLPVLREDLAEKFNAAKEEELSDSASSDVVIILGEK